MKKPLAITLSLCAFAHLANAKGIEVTDQQEVASIKEAFEIAITEVDALKCTYDSGKPLLDVTYRSFTRSTNHAQAIYRDFNGQPILIFEHREATYTYFVYVTTDREGKKITSLRMQRLDLGGAKTINTGTIAEPKIKKIPARLQVVFESICDTTKQ